MLVDGPQAKRQIVSEKQMRLTRHVIKGVLLNQRSKVLNVKWTADKIDDLWKASTWAKKIASKSKVRLLFVCCCGHMLCTCSVRR